MVGRPREFDRDDALRKARDLFWARGYEATSMADLVQALGLASARIYAAFGSKEALFRESVELYEAGEGGFATRALAQEPAVRGAIERVLREAIDLYTSTTVPRGCMVVSAATNCSPSNESVREWLAQHRRARTASVVERVQQAIREGEWDATANPQTLGDLVAAFLHGLSVQARDGVPRERLVALVPAVLGLLPPKNPAAGRRRIATSTSARRSPGSD